MGDTLKEIVESGLMPNGITFFVQIVSTIVLFYLFKKKVWAPMKGLLDKRREVIIGELESAKSAREEAQELKDHYANELKTAKEQAVTIVDNARTQANETKETIIREAQKEANYKREKAEKDIEQERARVEKELKAQAIDIAFAAAEKLVNENIDRNKNSQLIDKFIEEVGE